MPQSHNTTPKIKHGKAFAIGIILNLIFVAVEIFYGIVAGSSALLADAGHNASDVLSLVFAWGAAWLASRKPSSKYTYGLRRTTILVSILNAVLLFGAAGYIGWEAFQKFQNPVAISGSTVMWVAGIGVVINGLTTLLFVKGQKEDLNIRGAFLHMAADTAVSLGVVLAGLAIKLTGYYIIDPILTFVIIAVIVWSTWKLFTDSLKLALDAVPKSINFEEVKQYLLDQEGVEEVHDLHVWAMSTTQTALTVHLVMPEGNDDDFLFEVRDKLEKEFGIDHTTVQIENTFRDDLYRSNCQNC